MRTFLVFLTRNIKRNTSNWLVTREVKEALVHFVVKHLENKTI